MIILIDTDVLVDTALNRTPHADASSNLLDGIEDRQAMGVVSWHTLSNFYYLVSPKKGGPETRGYLQELSHFVQVVPTTTESLRYACQSCLKDFEDAMQVAAAVAGRADVIATRNIRDYSSSPIRAITPKQLVHELASL